MERRQAVVRVGASGRPPRLGAVVDREAPRGRRAVRWSDGEVQDVRTDDRAVWFLREGSPLVEWLVDPAQLRRHFRTDPVAVVAEIVRDQVRVTTQGIKTALVRAGVDGPAVDAVWVRVRAALKDDPAIKVHGASFEWQGERAETLDALRRLDPLAALARLAEETGLRPEIRSALAAAIQAGLARPESAPQSTPAPTASAGSTPSAEPSASGTPSASPAPAGPHPTAPAVPTPSPVRRPTSPGPTSAATEERSRGGKAASQGAPDPPERSEGREWSRGGKAASQGAPDPPERSEGREQSDNPRTGSRGSDGGRAGTDGGEEELERLREENARLEGMLRDTYRQQVQVRAGQDRQLKIDTVRSLAELAIEVEELAANGAEPEVIIERVRALAEINDLEPIGAAGENTAFDPTRHRPLAGFPDAGAPVSVVRPGYTWHSDDEDLLLEKAIVG